MKIKITKAVRFKGVAALAKATGYSATHISRVLHGAITPKPPLAKKLTALGVDFPTRGQVD